MLYWIATFVALCFAYAIGEHTGHRICCKQYTKMLFDMELLQVKDDGKTYWSKFAVGSKFKIIMRNLNRLQEKCGEEVTPLDL